MMKHATLEWRENGTPVAQEFHDIYFSTENGLAEAHHVFIEGNKLPERWAESACPSPFVVAELGFGTGLNFLATWQRWVASGVVNGAANKAANGACGHLEFISVEKFPLTEADLQQAWSHFPEIQAEAAKLLPHYQTLKEGWNIWHWPEERLTLKLFVGDVSQFLEEKFEAHAWFLDGFTPKENTEMWSASTLQKVACHTQPQGTFATFAVARMVRENLATTPFVAERAKGFGKKREMLKGVLGENLK